MTRDRLPPPAGPQPAREPSSQITRLLIEEHARLQELAKTIEPSKWLEDSILPGWKNFDILAHLIGTERYLSGQANPPPSPVEDRTAFPNEIARINSRWINSMSDLAPEELVASFCETVEVRRRQLESLDAEDLRKVVWTPVGDAPLSRFLEIRVFDCYVHEQDLRLSVSMPGHQSGPIPEFSLKEVRAALGYIVGKKAAFPTGTSVTFALTGGVSTEFNVLVTERATVVDHLDSATCRIAIDSNLFLMLACGRIRPDGAPANAITITGNSELANRLLANLAFTI